MQLGANLDDSVHSAPPGQLMAWASLKDHPAYLCDQDTDRLSPALGWRQCCWKPEAGHPHCQAPARGKRESLPSGATNRPKRQADDHKDLEGPAFQKEVKALLAPDPTSGQ